LWLGEAIFYDASAEYILSSLNTPDPEVGPIEIGSIEEGPIEKRPI
jgi:hypothetical protein